MAVWFDSVWVRLVHRPNHATHTHINTDSVGSAFQRPARPPPRHELAALQDCTDVVRKTYSKAEGETNSREGGYPRQVL
jgi:hypothetical protein